MGSSSQILHMIPIITIFTLISLQSSHILTADAADQYLKVLGVKNLYLLEERELGNEKEMEQVSGDDEGQEKEALIVEKFRALLGLTSFRMRSPSEYISPSPSPSPTMEANAPASAPVLAPAVPPMLSIHKHSHPPLHHKHPVPVIHKFQKEHRDEGRRKRVVVAVVVSAGAAAFVISVLGIILLSGKFRKRAKKSAKKVSAKWSKTRIRGKSKYVSSQKSASKVSLNPALDLLYLTALGSELEQQNAHFKQPTDNTSTLPNPGAPKRTLHEREDPNQDLVLKPEYENGSSSSTREIVSVHEDVEAMKYESDGGNSSSGDKIIPIECHSSDNESFHSFVDSFSPCKLVSNASGGSLGDISELSRPKLSKKSPPRPSHSINADYPQAIPYQTSATALNLQHNVLEFPNIHKEKSLTISSPPIQHKNFKPPAPTPPPPPPPPSLAASIHLPPSWTSSWRTTIVSKASPSLALQNDLPSSPQKSPQSSLASSSIPPPPCRPPFLKGKNSSAKGPPPPPSQLHPYVPLGKDGTPLPKLKPLHWDKVRAAPDRSTVWDRIRSSSFEFDEEMIESLFGYNLQSTLKKDEAKSKSPSPSKHLLEPKRLQNITILSKALNANAEQVCDALIRGDGLGLQQLEALAKMVPTKEEETKLSGYKGDINELVAAEKFVKVLLSIPFAFARVESMLYRETFEDEVVHLRNSFLTLEEACKELRSSRLFLKLLEAVLKTGNRMNVGTIRGGARAFKLDALLKLADVKGTDGKTSLLHFVVQEIIRSEGIRVADSIMGKINQKNKIKTIEEREEDYRRMGLDLVAGLSTELYNVKKTATIDIDVLANSVSNLSDGMTKLRHLAYKDLSMDEKSRNFVQSMKAFLNNAEKKLKELQEDEGRVLLHVREITEYFHGNASKEEANPLRIFVIVRDFLGMLDHVCKELRCIRVPNSTNPLAPFR